MALELQKKHIRQAHTFFTSFAEQNSGSNRKVAAFTSKEMDEVCTITGVSCEGLYYYGTRYLDAKYSRLLSADPAMSDYMSGSSAGGGIYNSVNFNLYHYAGNNPIKYTDPTGQWIKNEDGSYTAKDGDTLWGLSQLTGRNWRDTDYSGRPEDLQVNQTVRFRTEFDLKFEGIKIFLNATADICAVGSQLLKVWTIMAIQQRLQLLFH